MSSQQKITSGQRQQMIAEAAYFKAERRGFNGGDAVRDWCEAEAEIDAQLLGQEDIQLVERIEDALEAGQGSTAVFNLGGLSRIPGDAPLSGEFTVERLGDGRFTCTGPMFKGFRMTLGNMALLRSKAAPGVRVVVASRKVQAADQEMFRHVGVEPVRERILGLKSSVHFRADFEPIAKEVLVVKAPGPALADPTEFKWTKLRKGVRLRPMGPAYQG